MASKNVLDSIALSVRTLSMDGVRAANSGHPGLPMGLAELGALLFAEVLNYNPKNPKWINRDRLVLSAGHGSMWLYSLLHLSGYNISLSDLKKFRQIHSKTPGHPEYREVPGVETTTGPLGQGVANAVGMAMAEKMLAEKFNTSKHKIINNHVYAIAGDGCMMEGISSEAASLAGHLGLGNLTVFYDDNGISIEGATDLAFTENTAARFRTYNWQVISTSAYNYDGLRKAIQAAKADTTKPTLIVVKSTIGKGSPNFEGTSAVHGAPLPPEEIAIIRKRLKVPVDKDFFVAPEATAFFASEQKKKVESEKQWQAKLETWGAKNPEKKKMWKLWFSEKTPVIAWPKYKAGDSVATRKANGACIKAISEAMENFCGGSADLAPSNNTAMPGRKSFSAKSPDGRVIHYGVREHAMGAIMNGITVYGGLKVFGATFLVFSDYMRPAIRLAAIMDIPSIFIFTHDSIFVGEDGPTHQPIEHLAALRTIPNLKVFRPADAEESVFVWEWMLKNKKGPAAVAFTRQNITVMKKEAGWKTSARGGAYVVSNGKSKNPDVVLAATGSEVEYAQKAAVLLQKDGISARVVSIVSKELLDAQTATFKKSIFGASPKIVTFEAGVTYGWGDLATLGSIGIDTFGVSGPQDELRMQFKIDEKSVANEVKRLLKKS